MVNKLFKHEMSALARMLIPVNLVCLALSLMFRLTYFIQDKFIDNSVFGTLSSLLLTFFILSVLAVFFVSYAMIIVRFYKHLLSSEGYLSMTLPVKPSSHIITKTVCGMIFMIISAIVVIGSAMIAASSSNVFPYIMSDLWKGVKMLANDAGPSIVTQIIIEIVLIMFFSLVNSILMPYAAMALGQCARKRKVGMSIAWYFIISFVLNIIRNVVTLVTMSFIGSFNIEDAGTTYIGDIIRVSGGHIMLIENILFTAVTAIVFYIITHYVLKNKLNLE